MNRSESITELAKALAVAQGEVENASKTSKNDHFKNKYADLAEVLNTVRPVFAKHGLSIVQLPSYEQPLASVETILMHSSGEYISGVCSAPVTKPDPQGVGSAITYLRRYSLAAVAGIAQEDDDANSASGKGQQPAPRQQPATQLAPQAAAYADADFKKNLPGWAERIRGGKNPDELIAFVESKGRPFTEEQKQALRAIKPAQEA